MKQEKIRFPSSSRTPFPSLHPLAENAFSSMFVVALAVAAVFILFAAPALADGLDAPAPPAPPPSETKKGDEAPRQDFRMGTTDHMRMGRDEDGNRYMEVGPRPKTEQQTPNVGPIYVVPQFFGPGGAPGPGSGAAGTGTGTPAQQAP